ncbi:uncharacterized protein LOC121425612 isoform X2 [Lytechinus variegatus]|uniref:uncharacterized protein LOC121425612 isoform X2 n=1 Tax=Lytechinus variegatus TaxID=7654 RepID=UPI001BB2143B|nr:uncharacterized protein LOC121425612 isoform X2 [Lytechinus variegatus]
MLFLHLISMGNSAGTESEETQNKNMDRTQALSRKRRHSSRQGASTSHDEDEQPPRSRLRTSRLSGRTSSSSVEIVDIPPQAVTPPIHEEEPIDLSLCIVDLTDETETTRNRPLRNSSQDDIVDLTVETHAVDRAPRRMRRTRRGRLMRNSQRGNIIPILSDDSDEENDVMVLPEIDLGETYRTARDETSNSTATGPGRGRQTSPKKRVITCPICMEDETTVSDNGYEDDDGDGKGDGGGVDCDGEGDEDKGGNEEKEK